MFSSSFDLSFSRQNYTDASEDAFVSLLTNRKSNEQQEVDIDLIHQSVVLMLNDKPPVCHSRQLCITNSHHFKTVVAIWRSAAGGRETPNGQIHNKRLARG